MPNPLTRRIEQFNTFSAAEEARLNDIADHPTKTYAQAPANLDASDQEALLGLPYTERTYEPGRYIVREGQIPDSSALILSGLAYRHKLTPERLHPARATVRLHSGLAQAEAGSRVQ